MLSRKIRGISIVEMVNKGWGGAVVYPEEASLRKWAFKQRLEGRAGASHMERAFQKKEKSHMCFLRPHLLCSMFDGFQISEEGRVSKGECGQRRGRGGDRL